MSCTNYKEIIQDWMDTPGSPSMPMELRDHLLTCTDCTQWIRRWNSIEIGLSSMRSETPPPSFTFRSDIKDAVEAGKRRTIFTYVKANRRILAFGSAGLCATCLALYFALILRQEVRSTQQSLATIHDSIPLNSGEKPR